MFSASAGVLQSLFDGIDDGVCVADGRGLILYRNPAAERLLRRAGGEAGALSVCDGLCAHLDLPGGEARCGPCPLLDAGAPERAMTFAGLRDGASHGLRVRCLQMNLDATTPHSYPGHLIFIEDASQEIDQRRRSEDWRSMMVHDLRVPLSCAFGALRALQDEEPDKKSHDKEMLEIGVRACRKMADLLEEFLDAARLMNGASAPPQAVGLAEIVSSCVRDARTAARARRVELSFAAQPGLTVLADSRLLSRLIQNLLDNALKHTPDGGAVTVSARAAGSSVELSVKDTGDGIPPEALPRLFERFYQAPRDRRIGAGLGLAFCREAAQAMGGDVVVAATSARGTEMLVTFRSAGPGDLS